MIRNTLAIAYETYLLLLRDKAFLPALVIGSFSLFFAFLAMDWGIEEFVKILFDVGAAGYHITGSIVALLWGTKTICDSRSEGSIEVQLASPLTRTSWYLGKYLGIVLNLITLAVVLIVFWQAMMMLFKFGWLSQNQLWIFTQLTLGWCVIAAVSVFFASFASSSVALFSSSCFWIAGLFVGSLPLTLAPDTPQMTRTIVVTLSKVWDLQAFNLSNLASSDIFPPTIDMLWRLGYGGLLIGVFLSWGCLIFNRRDLV